MMLVVTTLAGCGTAQQPAQYHSDVARAAEPVLASALAGEQPRAAADPHALARQITVAETAVRDRATPREVVAAAGRTARPALVKGFTRNTFIAMIESVRDDALVAGLTTRVDWDRGIADLRRSAADGGTFHYTFFKASATKSVARSKPLVRNGDSGLRREE